MNNLCRHLVRIPLNSSCNRLFATPAFKSALSLGNIYPNSSLKLTTPSQVPIDPNAKFGGYIPINELEITYSKSSGPGGQNVNKVNTKVEIRFQLETASWLEADIKSKLKEKWKNKMTKDGFLIFRSDLTRSQQLNLADCLEKLRNSVRKCTAEEKTPSPETEEKIRRRLERATEERLALKRDRSSIKAQRQSPDVVI